MGLIPLVSQHLTLADAEAVLFVGDDEGKLIVDYLFLYERMGSNDDIRLMGGDLFVSSTLLLCRHGAGYQHDLFLNAVFFKQGEHGLVVLTRKNLRRHHKSTLKPVAGGLQQSEDGDYGFTGAHISLN